MKKEGQLTVSRRRVVQASVGASILTGSSNIPQKYSTESNFTDAKDNLNRTSSTDQEGSFWSDIGTGTWIGLLGTIFGSFGLYILRQRSRRSRLSTALVAELKRLDTIADLDEALQSKHSGSLDDEISPSEVPPAGMLPTSVYESNLSNIGLLDDGTTEDVVSFYSELIAYKSIIESINTGKELSMADQNELFDNIESLETSRKELIHELGGELSDKDE